MSQRFKNIVIHPREDCPIDKREGWQNRENWEDPIMWVYLKDLLPDETI